MGVGGGATVRTQWWLTQTGGNRDPGENDADPGDSVEIRTVVDLNLPPIVVRSWRVKKMQ